MGGCGWEYGYGPSETSFAVLKGEGYPPLDEDQGGPVEYGEADPEGDHERFVTEAGKEAGDEEGEDGPADACARVHYPGDEAAPGVEPFEEQGGAGDVEG